MLGHAVRVINNIVYDIRGVRVLQRVARQVGGVTVAKGKRHIDTFFLELIYNLKDGRDTLFFARLKLTPSHPRHGGLYLHLFFRGDEDPDPHDHPWDFWTFPLQGYVEEIMNFNGKLYFNYVKPWRWTFRHASHVHRVLPWRYRWYPKINLVWHGPEKQRWGFFVHPGSPYYYLSSSLCTRGAVRKVHWRDYIYGESYGEAEARL